MNILNRRIAALIAALFVAASLFAQAPENRERGFAADKLYQFGGIDNINLFNGNLVLTVPIGQTYTVSPQIGYGLTLTYNSTVWDYDKWCQHIDDPELGQPDEQCIGYVIPAPVANAGMGWYLSLGELIPPLSRYHHPGRWEYVTPDGGRHDFGSDGISNDAEMLRMRVLSSGDVEIDSPDGVIRRFKQGTDVYHLVEIRDAYSQGTPGAATTNFVHIVYDSLTPLETGAEAWEIIDSAGRHQKIYFRKAPLDLVDYTKQIPIENGAYLPPPRDIVSRVELTAFDGSTDTYTFDYDTHDGVIGSVITRDNDHDGDPDLTQEQARVALLTAVHLPDGSSYTMTKPDGVTPDYESANALESSGVLYSLTLPTRAKFAWTYARREYPKKGDEKAIKPRLGAHDFQVDSLGVTTKKITDPVSGTTKDWSYTMTLTPISDGDACLQSLHKACEPREMVMTVIDPMNIKTENFFSVALDLLHQADGWHPKEYGLPLTHNDTSQTARQLSTRVWTLDGTGIQRSTYVAYEGKIPFQLTRFMRLKATRSVFNDDDDCPACYVDTESSLWDGYGHYRKAVTTHNFPSAGTGDIVSRTAFTNYNGATPENGEQDTDEFGKRGADPAFLPGDPWILNTFTSRSVSQTVGTTTTLESLSLFDFEPATGFLRRQRTMITDQPRAHDLLSVFARDSHGNVASESYYGGDLQDLDLNYYPTQTVPPSTPVYRIEHSFQDGVLASSTYKNGSSNFLETLDLTIDTNTGFAHYSRDASGLQTTFTYGPLGRLTVLQPPAGTGAPAASTHYTYHNASGSTGAYVDVDQPADGSLSHGSFHFDGIGQVVREVTRMPDGDVARVTKYNANGWKTDVSEREPAGSAPLHWTTYTDFDSLGRAHKVVPPDSGASHEHDVVTDYLGTRIVRRKVKVATAANGDESWSTTTEVHDAFEHLRRVDEPSGANGANVSTFYRYDGADHLIEASTTDSNVTQTREFKYDHRGFLLSEKNPEKGLNGNGFTFYGPGSDGSGGYDARGHMLRRREEGITKYDQDFAYDPAERLIQVMEHTAQRPLKQFFFDSISDSTHSYQSPGRVVKSVRHNYSTQLGDVTVANYFQYDAAGRVASKETSISSGPSFTQLFTYTPLGAPDKLTFPSCTGCASANLPQRQLTLGYDRGLLTSVNGVASHISYWPNGMINTINHTNGVDDVQNMDQTTGMARPKSIEFRNVTSCSDVVITTQPVGGRINAGGNRTMTVAATAPAGFSLGYQWYQGTSGDQSHAINGATGSSFTTPALNATTSYWVKVSSDSCSVNSQTATVQVCPPIVITQQPRSSMLAPTGSDTLVTAFVAATGEDLHVRWLNEAGAVVHDDDDTDMILKVHFYGTSTQFLKFKGEVYDPCDKSLTSEWFTLGIGSCLTVSAHPQDAVVFQGASSFLMSFRIFGENLQPPYKYTYHWHHGVNGQDIDLYQLDAADWNKPEVTGTLLNTLYDAWWCEVESPDCGNVTSLKAYVHLYGTCPLPPLSVSPLTVQIANATHTFTASCDWPSVTYQWFKGAAGDTHIPKGTGKTYEPTEAGMYWVRVTDECGTNHKDSPTLVASTSSCAPVVITTQPQSVDIAWGQRPTLYVEAAPATTYTWYTLDQNGNTASSNVAGPSYAPALAPTVSTAYEVFIQNSCDSALSLPAMVHIKSCATINVTAQPANGVVLTGQTAGLDLSVTATSSGGPITYIWYRGESGDSRFEIGRGSNVMHVLPNVTTSYWVRMQTSQCTIDSDTAVVTVCTPPGFTTPNVPVTNDITYGQAIMLGANVQGDGLHYVWHAGSPTSDVIVGTESKVWVHPVDTTIYYGVISGACGDAIITEPITVRVCRTPVIDEQPQSISVFSGNPATLHVGVTELNNVPVTYVWQEIGGGNVGTSATLTTGAITSPKQYMAHISAGACSVDSAIATVSVCTLPEILHTGSTQNVAAGQTVTLTCNVSPAAGNVYTWYQGTPGDFAHSGQVSYNSSYTYSFTAAAGSEGTY